MKKKVLTLVLVIGSGIMQINAQSVNYGLKADATLFNFIMQDFDDVKSNMDIGVSVGGFANISLTSHFALQPELLFHLKDTKFKQKPSEEKRHFEYWGVEIPIYAMGNIDLWNGKAYLGIGPYVSFGIDAKYNVHGCHTGVYKKNKITDKSLMQRWDFGAGAMLGYEFKCGIQINAGYKIGFIDAMDAGKENATMLNQTVSLGIGYRF